MLVATSVHMWECQEPVNVTLWYDGPDPHVRRFTRTIRIDSGFPVHEATRVMGPAYRGFHGVTVEPAACERTVHRVEAEEQPLWVTAVLAPGWRDFPLYQRLGNPLLVHKPLPNFEKAWNPHR